MVFKWGITQFDDDEKRRCPKEAVNFLTAASFPAHRILVYPLCLSAFVANKIFRAGSMNQFKYHQ
jgi:hypothetical protein